MNIYISLFHPTIYTWYYFYSIFWGLINNKWQVGNPRYTSIGTWFRIVCLGTHHKSLIRPAISPVRFKVNGKSEEESTYPWVQDLRVGINAVNIISYIISGFWSSHGRMLQYKIFWNRKKCYWCKQFLSEEQSVRQLFRYLIWFKNRFRQKWNLRMSINSSNCPWKIC